MYDPKQQSYTKAEFEKLRDEKKPEQRAVICIYCNIAILYSDDESKDKIYTLMKEHDKICQCNPLVAEIDRLTAEIERLKEQLLTPCVTCNAFNENDMLKGLLGMAVCPNCDGSGSIPHQVSSETRVSRDMAIDAGMPELEGSIYTPDAWEEEQCQWCDERNEALKGELK